MKTPALVTKQAFFFISLYSVYPIKPDLWQVKIASLQILVSLNYRDVVNCKKYILTARLYPVLLFGSSHKSSTYPMMIRQKALVIDG